MSGRWYRFIASNLHAGGGVQVGASLIDEIAVLADNPRWRDLIASTVFEVSESVARNVRPESLARLHCRVINRRPGNWRSKLGDLRRCEGSLVVFGPIYSFPRASRRVMGYADVTSVYPSATGTPSVRAQLRGWLSCHETARQDDVVVETRAMAARLQVVLGSRLPRVHVIPNSINSRLITAEENVALQERLASCRKEADLLLAYPTRAYPHKNLDFLPQVAAELWALGTRVRFVVTLRDAEMKSMGADFSAVCINVGELTIDQMATLVRGSDGVFFPSLLEAYSATPLETLALGVPLFASDREFVRTLCGEAALYFDPRDAKSAARAVLDGVDDSAGRERRGVLGTEIASAVPNARSRAGAFLSLLYGERDPASTTGQAS